MRKKKIKILYTIPNFDTAGSGKVVYDLVNNLDKTKFLPEICCFHSKGEFYKEVEKLGVKIHLFGFSTQYKPLISLPFRVLKIALFFRKHKFDLIHSWHWSSDFTEPLASKISGIPWLYTKKSMGWGNKAWKWRSSLSSKIVTINSDMPSHFFTNMIEKVIEVPLGIDTKRYHFQEKSLHQDGLTFKDSDFVIISVVNLIPVKGIEFLMNAILELKDSTIKLCIVGKDTGAYAEKLKVMAKESNAIYFLGKQLDVRPYHALADLFVIPTLELGEGLPMAPVEAMSSGRIVIGSNVSGVKDVLKDFPECLFAPSSVESIKKKILEMKSLSRQKKETMQLEMRSYATTHFSKENFISNHEKLYIELIK